MGAGNGGGLVLADVPFRNTYSAAFFQKSRPTGTVSPTCRYYLLKAFSVAFHAVSTAGLRTLAISW